MPLVWFMPTMKQQCFLQSQFVFCFFFFNRGVCVYGRKLVNISWDIFFVRKANPSWMKARDQTRWRLAWIQEKGINKESGERAGVWKRLLSLLVGQSQISLATADVWPSPPQSEEEDAETTNFRGRRFFQVRWVPRQPNKRRRQRCAECACLLLPVAPPLTGLAAAALR